MSKQKEMFEIVWMPVKGQERGEKRKTEPSLEELRKFVDGDIEMLERRGTIFVINENGWREGLDPNPLAARLYGSPLLGNVVVYKKV